MAEPRRPLVPGDVEARDEGHRHAQQRQQRRLPHDAGGGTVAGEDGDGPSRDTMEEVIHHKERRKLAARRRREQPVWFGLGMFGLVGWSVAIPTLVGVAVGAWLDAHYPRPFSWTLTLMLAGLVVGCFQAWRWIDVERRDG